MYSINQASSIDHEARTDQTKNERRPPPVSTRCFDQTTDCNMKTKSALSWFGSDAEFAERIGRYFDSCSHVTLPFCGGASILPFIKANRIVCNDLNDLAINFYMVASGHLGEGATTDLIRMSRTTLSHPGVLHEASLILQSPDVSTIVETAWAYWAFCWLA